MNGDLLEDIYRRYYNDVYLYAYSLCRSRHKAQELTSDTFFKALLSCDRETPSMKYWLLRVCKNTFLDERRKERKRGLFPLDDLPLKADEQDPLDQILQKNAEKSLYQAILRLPEATREVLLLFYFHGFSGKQIADMTGRTPGAVRTLLYRARTQLRDLLKGDLE